MSSRGKRYAHESAGNGNSSTSGEWFCDCGLKAPLKVSKSAANPGREYYSCPARRCKWFLWAGPTLSCSARPGSQIHEQDVKETKFDLDSNLQLNERIGKIENECIVVEILAYVPKWIKEGKGKVGVCK
ncbi:hypothetical protein PIB30_063901 [Stylosanthes scabra]|uniref:GRF-type domain-containing protein n=1 Tax=Stylosanthes scabra TaxID=79078 RepID=A0ABU6QNJ7_9FABA|nr:hypothetical protein [Stylosanthes scabra]